jgi:hypothetical protein
MKGIRITKSIEVFFVILIILGLCISAVVLMDAGKKAYENILENNSQLENARVALSYLGMRLRQNNAEGSVQYIENGIEGADVIKLVHSGDFEGMVTYIYFSNGELKELFTWADAEPDPGFGETIVSLGGLDIKAGEGYFKFTAHYSEDGYPKRLEQIIGIMGN